MTRFTTLAAACCAIAATVSLGTPAQAENLEALFPERSQAELDYLDAHRCVVEKLGAATAGNNYVLSGYNAKEGNRAPTDDELQEGTARLETACNPPPVPEPVYTEEVPTTTNTVAPVASGSGCPASMAPESGSAGYSALNSSSGAMGCYQIMPMHYGSGGSCSHLGTDPAGQDACAAILCSESGAEPWAASGANPC